MANVVFILGAGASRKAGGPLMSDFLDVADGLWRTNSVGDKAASFKQVFAAIGAMQSVQSKAQLDLTNIESVFNALEMARILKKFPGSADASVEATIEALKILITTTLDQTIKFPVSSNQILPPAPYSQFADLLQHLTGRAHPPRPVAVLTFNYDLAADYALHFHSLGPDYCLGDGGPSGVPLLKLHGSTNWAVCQSCDRVAPYHFAQFFRRYRVSLLGDLHEFHFDISSKFPDFPHCNRPVCSLPFLVPPTWNKTEHYKAIQVVWERAAHELTDAENIFIVGYSLPQTDAFFRTLYALGTVGGTPLKRVWVFDPDKSGETEIRFRNLMGPGAISRFKYFPFVFDGAINVIKQEFPERR